MKADTVRMRVGRPFVFTDLRMGSGVEEIARFIIEQGGLAKSAA
jgi:urease accessory protein